MGATKNILLDLAVMPQQVNVSACQVSSVKNVTTVLIVGFFWTMKVVLNVMLALMAC